MEHIKQVGIWMDHARANIMEAGADIFETKIIMSAFTHDAKAESLGKTEHLMHNKEQQQQSAYYKKIGESIINYDEVLLFGPTNAKAELLNIVQADHRFNGIKFEIKQADKMSEKQQHAFIRDHFKQK
jgi:hypothetical protein